MRTLMGLVLVGGLVLGLAGDSKAQFGLSIGTPAGYSYGYPNFSSYGYSGLGYGGGLGYSGLGYGGYNGLGYGGYNGLGYGGVVSNNYYSSGLLGGPGGFSYSSGYRGLTTPAAPLTGYGYGYGVRPYYGGYGYRGYGYGNRNGFRPLRGVGRMFR